MAKTTLIAISPPANASARSGHAGPPSVLPKSSNAPSSAHSESSRLPSTPNPLTSKEWVVPPRPKPGRKPATDIPPTKRKAQNRAAQRAFRERRAARVGELEEELKRIEQEDEEEQNTLRAHIEKLDKDVEKYRTSLDFWMQRCRGLEAELAVASAAQKALRSSKEISTAPALQSNSFHDLVGDATLPESAAIMGCGNCSSISNCSCIQEVINMPDSEHSDSQNTPSHKRTHSPPHNHSNPKRIKPEPPDELETDFTNSFTNKEPINRNRQKQLLLSPSSAVADLCGFCSDGTACICAEMQAEEVDNNNNNNNNSDIRPQHDDSGSKPTPSSSSLRSRISQLSHITPPPSDTDVSLLSSSQAQSASSPSRNLCINGPGTCLQCRSDPNSTLFCKSLAKSREQQHQKKSVSAAPLQSDCCSSTPRPNGPCCRSSNPTTAPITRPHSITLTPPITLSCADAYTTLSRHPGYEKAMSGGQMASWLPKLHARTHHHFISSAEEERNVAKAGQQRLGDGVGREEGRGGARPAMEMEAANVMAVLKEFDRRFP